MPKEAGLTEIADAALTLESSKVTAHQSFAEWYDSLIEGATSDSNGIYRLGEVSFRRLRSRGTQFRINFWMGTSPDSVVQINEPLRPGTENTLGAIATDQDGCRFVLRQGRLKQNDISSDIWDEDFAEATGLPILSVNLSDDTPAQRQWHLVTALDGMTSSEIQAATVEFVHRCWQARLSIGKGISVDRTLSDEDREWAEGNKKLVTHLRRERHPGLASKKRAQFLADHGFLFCERCKLEPRKHFESEDGDACIEVHHSDTMVSQMQSGHLTKLEDLQCLCANCHRYVHRILKREAKAGDAVSQD